MKYTAGQAAEATGVSTATISRALKKGRISAVKDDAGSWQIEPAELHRVFPIVKHAKPLQEHMQSDVIPTANNPLQAEIDVLRERLKAAEALAEERGRHLDDLRRLLPSPSPAAEARRWRWPWQT